MYEYGNWEQCRSASFLGIHKSNLLCSVVVAVVGRVLTVDVEEAVFSLAPRKDDPAVIFKPE
jgi:hypothetical protein